MILTNREVETALISIAMLQPRQEFQVTDEHKVFDGQNILKLPSGISLYMWFDHIFKELDYWRYK